MLKKRNTSDEDGSPGPRRKRISTDGVECDSTTVLSRWQNHAILSRTLIKIDAEYSAFWKHNRQFFRIMIDGCCDVEIVLLWNVYNNCMNSLEGDEGCFSTRSERMRTCRRIIASISQEFTTVFLHRVNGVLQSVTRHLVVTCFRYVA